jgi:quercetin 2,3-dioxygenase
MAALAPRTANAERRIETAIVGDGVDRWGKQIRASGFPWVKVSSKDTGGAWSMFESPVLPQTGVPLHVHNHQEEWFYVREGEFLFEIGGQRHSMAAGASILGPRGIPHRFKNAGTGPGKLLILCQPAGLMEECSAALARMAEVDRRKAEKIKAVLAQYDIDVIGPPLA